MEKIYRNLSIFIIIIAISIFVGLFYYYKKSIVLFIGGVEGEFRFDIIQFIGQSYLAKILLSELEKRSLRFLNCLVLASSYFLALLIFSSGTLTKLLATEKQQ